MTKSTSQLELLDTMLQEATNRGLLHLDVDDTPLDGREIVVGGRRLVNFGSCSYLGLEVDPRLKQGAIDAVERYGTQFSASRTYASAPPYAALEAAFEELFGGPALLAPTTSLAHLSALPVLIGEEDVILIDQLAHHSLRIAANQLVVRNVPLEMVRHNRLDELEQRIEELKAKHRHIWYVADGVYSMYGDFAPLADIEALLARHEQLHVYIDDAHGMSWTGRHGRGRALGSMAPHPRMVVATSLAKAFGAGGGVLVFPDAELCRKVRTCGGPMIFSGPLQPPTLGACLASARIHLSEEMPSLQAALHEKIALTHRLLLEHGLPVMSAPDSPIHFVGLGLPRVSYNMAERLTREGFYTNLAMFPAVPMRRSGIRFTSTLHQTREDIARFVSAFADHLPSVLREERTDLDTIYKAFRLPLGQSPPQTPRLTVSMAPPSPEQPTLTLEHHRSIDRLDPAEWDRLLGTRGTFTWEGLRCLEAAFSDNAAPENNWNFHYYVVRDQTGKAVLATFFTEGLWKDDMLSKAEVSQAVELRRHDDPYFLTSRNMAMGSLLTDGDHLYLDRTADWRAALKLVLVAVTEAQERHGATGMFLRDLPVDDPELEQFLRDEGFLRYVIMESLERQVDWVDDEDWLAKLSQKARKHQRKKVLPYDGWYDVEILDRTTRRLTPAEVDHVHRLYCNVKANNLELNTFELPPKLFRVLDESPAWELVLIRLKPEFGGDPAGLPVGVSCSFIGPDAYIPLIFGLDYRFVASHGAYRQLLRLMFHRAKALGSKRLLLGIGATFEKTRYGAEIHPRAVYFQTNDHYQLEVLEQLKAEVVPR